MKRFLNGALLAATLALLTASPVSAQGNVDNTAFGSTSAEFLLFGAGARGAALGGSFAAIADDITALYWNPGGLALIDRPGISASTYDYVANTRYSWVGLAVPFGEGARALGVHGATYGFSDQPVYTVENPEGDGSTYSVSQTYVGLTYSQNFSDRFSAGLTAKVITDELGRASATGFAVDFGTSFHAMIGSRPIRASFVLQNLGSTLQHQGSGLDVQVLREPPLGQETLPQEAQPANLRTKDFGLPVIFRIGLAFDFINSSSSRVTLMSEFNQPNNTNATANGGLEWALPNIGNSGFSVAARGSYTYQPDNDLDPDADLAGFNTGLSSQENRDGLAFGGGIGWHARTGFGITVDYAYRDLGVLGGTNFISATLNW